MNGIFIAASMVAIFLGLGSLLAAHGSARERRLIAQRVLGISRSQVRNAPDRTHYNTAIRILRRVSGALTRDIGAMSRLVQAAGVFNAHAVYAFLAARILLTLLAGMTALVVSAAVGTTPIYAALAITTATGAGFLLPTYLLRYRANRRRRKIKRELPLFLDSLKLLLQSGVSVEIALRHIARMEVAIIPEIQKSLRSLEEDLDQGRDYPVTFERWANRLSLPEAREVVGILMQSLQFGGETVPMLGTLVGELIERRLSDARLVAGKRSVVLTLAMVVFFLPPLILIVIGPAVTGIIRNITGVGG